MLEDTSALAQKISSCFDSEGDFKVIASYRAGASDDADERSTRQQEFSVWSAILASWSDVFAAMFKHDCVEKGEKKVVIKDFSPRAVESFLRFLYSGRLNADPGDLVEVGALADKYAVSRLRELCAQAINAAMTPENACEMLLACDRVGAITLRQECLDVIFSKPTMALLQAFMLSSSLMEEVLSSPKLCIGDFELAQIILEWARNPAAVAHKTSVPSLLQHHVQFAALTDVEQSKVSCLADEVGLLQQVKEMLVRTHRGQHTEDLFVTLRQKYDEQFPQRNNFPPYIGHWVNLIPSSQSFGQEYSASGLETMLMNWALGNHWTLGANEELTWMMPHHAIYVKAIRFTCALGEGNHIKVSCSQVGVDWDLLFDSSCMQGDITEAFPCRSHGMAKWFKVRVCKGSYRDAKLCITGILQKM